VAIGAPYGRGHAPADSLVLATGAPSERELVRSGAKNRAAPEGPPRARVDDEDGTTVART